MNKALPYLLVSAFLAIAFLVGYCNRPEEPAELRTPADQTRQREINVDSIRSEIESQYRKKLQSQIKADSARYTAWQANYKPKAQKAKEAVSTYRKTPTLANCDSAVTKLESQVAEMETGLAISDSITKGQSQVIASYAGSLARKDSVIDTLNAGWQQANADNAELTRKDKRKNKLLKIGAGIIALLLGGLAVK